MPCGFCNWQKPVIPRNYVRVEVSPRLVDLPQEYQNAVARFDRALAGMNRAPDTRRLYCSAVRQWLLFGGAPGHLDGALVARYLAGMRERCATATVNLAIKALKAFYRLQAEFGIASNEDHMRLPRMRRPAVRMPRWLTVDQIGEILASLPLGTFVGLRDFTLIQLLFDTGIRAGEAARLELGDVLDDGLLFVRGKGGQDRYAPLSDEVLRTLQGYIKARAGLRPGKRVALWLANSGRPLANGRSIWEIVQRRVWAALGRKGGWHCVERVGRPWRGHYPHELRASFATALLERGCPVTAISQLLGHKSIDSTAHYLGVDVATLKKAAACHPRAKRFAT